MELGPPLQVSFWLTLIKQGLKPAPEPRELQGVHLHRGEMYRKPGKLLRNPSGGTCTSHWETRWRRTGRRWWVTGIKTTLNHNPTVHLVSLWLPCWCFLLESVISPILVQIAVPAVQNPGPAQPTFPWPRNCETHAETTVPCQDFGVSASKTAPVMVTAMLGTPL